MENNDKDLFKTSEVTSALGVTRRMLINYEDLGLLTPAVRHSERGFRYYSANNMAHIRGIRMLQNLGLSLEEIRSYFNDTTQLDEQINQLILLRNQLDQHISQLQLRQTHINEPEIIKVTLPAFTAFCREFHDADLKTKTDELRKTYIGAAKRYKMDLQNKMCTQLSYTASGSDGLYVIPVMPESKGENIRSFPQVSAICVYYRGAYEGFFSVHSRLLKYAKENGMTPHGYFRNIFIEGPPTHGANKEAYLTQIVLPIKFISTGQV